MSLGPTENRVVIRSVGSYVPPTVFRNQDLETMMDTTHDWIVQRTGIEERRWVEPHVSTSDLAYEASMKAIERAESSGLKKEEIDMIILATLSPDHDFPGTGCFLQHKLGLGEISVLDIRQQCSGFIYGMSIAEKFILSGSHKNILLVGAEVHSKGLDKTPQGRNVSVLFGDGAGAVILSHVKAIHSNAQEFSHSKILNTELFANGEHAKELWLPAPGFAFPKERLTHHMIDEGLHYPVMNGKSVFVHATKKMTESLLKSLEKTQLKISDIDLFLFHQANLRINSKVAEDLGIPENKVYNTIQKYGNTTAATIPLGMNHALEAGVLKRGMTVASAAFGSGFTWGSAIYIY